MSLIIIYFGWLLHYECMTNNYYYRILAYLHCELTFLHVHGLKIEQDSKKHCFTYILEFYDMTHKIINSK